MTRRSFHGAGDAQASLQGIDRRRFLGGLAGTALGASLHRMFVPDARADGGTASRVIFFYFPDGGPGASAGGDGSAWHCTGPERAFTLSETLDALAPYAARTLFLNGMSMGPTDSGSHPGGAKKLLTAVDHGNGESIDHLLARTVGANTPHRHLYLGAMANQNNASGDKHISYPGPGQSIAPEDDPGRAFSRLFGGPAPTTPVGPAPTTNGKSVIDAAIADIEALRTRLGVIEDRKLALHLESLRELERRIEVMPPMPPPNQGCNMPDGAPYGGVPANELYAPERVGDVLRAQIDLMVHAMACGLTKVGVIQASHHTSDLIMSRMMGTEMFEPSGDDMRSHQASHYGDRHDRSRREFRHFLAQRNWWVQQFVHLLDELERRPEGNGTMLDNSIVVLCSEVSDGNTHSHDQMPFVVTGGAGGAWSTGRLLNYDYERHGKLLVSISRAMGHHIDRFGDADGGGLPGVL